MPVALVNNVDRRQKRGKLKREKLKRLIEPRRLRSSGLQVENSAETRWEVPILGKLDFGTVALCESVCALLLIVPGEKQQQATQRKGKLGMNAVRSLYLAKRGAQ